jgi:hypothetical protein
MQFLMPQPLPIKTIIFHPTVAFLTLLIILRIVYGQDVIKNSRGEASFLVTIA